MISLSICVCVHTLLLVSKVILSHNEIKDNHLENKVYKKGLTQKNIKYLVMLTLNV